MKISGFTFVHNALEGGYPIREAMQTILPYVDEIVVIDMGSIDGTKEFIKNNFPWGEENKLNDQWEIPSIKIIEGQWGSNAGETLKAAHALHVLCEHDTILHFEADEVYSDNLLHWITYYLESDYKNIAVYRLQLEQNFQRCRWYPELVHRVFPKGSVVKEGHTTNKHNSAMILDPEHGFLWDITNCFRDNWRQRLNQQRELWHNVPQPKLHVPIHFEQDTRITKWEDGYNKNIDKFLAQDHWTWSVTPFNIPNILKPLVGKVKYA